MDKSVLIQKHIRDNSEDLQNYMRDLKLWESEMKRKDIQLTGNTSESDVLPPVRTKRKKKTEPVSKQGVKEITKRISGNDYSSWDKFDVDKACEEIDKESSEENTDESDVDEAVVKREEALYQKAIGNRYVQDGKWDEAISAYSQAIISDPKDAVFYANRALCYLKKKKWKEAESDCTMSIQIDSSYVKAYHRRAEAMKQMEKFEEAKKDLLTIIQLEPNNSLAKHDLEKLEARLKPAAEKIKLVESKSQKSSAVSSKKEEKVTKVEKCLSLSESEPLWSSDVCLVEPIDKPPHLRSKKPLKRIFIKEINSVQNSKCREETGERIQSATETPLEVKQVELKKSVISVPSTSTVKDTVADNKDNSTEKESGLLKMDNTSDSIEELPPPPKSSVQFELYWKKIKNNKFQCYRFLKQLQGNDLRTIFKESLESNTFSGIISILASEFIAAGEPVLNYLKGLTQVRRFGALTLFMSSDDKSNLIKLFDHCRALGECSEENISKLKKLYEI